MSDQIEELLKDILSELKSIAEDVSSLKLHSDLADDNSGIVEALDTLGDRITGGYGGSHGADLDDVARALSGVETAVEADDNSVVVEALDTLGDRITGRYGESLGADLDDVVRALRP